MGKLKLEDLNRNMTNDELRVVIKSQLKSGNLVVIDKIPSEKNDEYVNIYVAQNVPDLPSSGNQPVTNFEKKALGWDHILMRARFNATVDYADELELGEEIEDAKIRVYDMLEPSWDDQEPRKDRDENPRTTADGELIYRNTHVVDEDEFEEFGGHEVIAYVIHDEDDEEEEVEETAPKKKKKTTIKKTEIVS